VYKNILPIDPWLLANKFKCNGTFVTMRQAICYLYSFVFALICMFRLQEGPKRGKKGGEERRKHGTADIFAWAESKYQTVPGMAN